MPVIRTDRWLDEQFFHPYRLCEPLKAHFENLDPPGIYQFLAEKGMYKPSGLTFQDFVRLKEMKVWDRADKYLDHFRKRWKGPDIPVYIFPANHSLFSPLVLKNGYTLPGAMFLFLTPQEDGKELKALFVHEYHHAARLHRLGRKTETFTLLDSLVMEGLAEHAVSDSCGEKYVARWMRRYTEKQIAKLWEKYFRANLRLKTGDPGHDRLLYGMRGVPPMAGYAVGFAIVKACREKLRCRTDEMIAMSAERIAEPFLAQEKSEGTRF